MISHLFIHASFAVKNIRDSENFILDDLNGKPALLRMINRLQDLEQIQKINIVTSSSDCDNRIAQFIEAISAGFTRVPVSLIRIPDNVAYRIDESNRYIGSDFTVKIPYYGFHSAECMLDYLNFCPVDCSVILNAEDAFMVEPDTIDWLVTSYNKKGIFLKIPNTNIGGITVVPSAEFSAKLASLKYRRQRDLKDTATQIKETCAELNLSPQTESAKIEYITQYYNRPALCVEILDIINDGNYACRNFPFDKNGEFYPLHLKSDLEYLNNFYNKLDNLSLDNFSTFFNEINSVSNVMYPVVVEVELTNRCNMSCDNCPKIVSSRPPQDISMETFKSIVDKFSQKSLFLFLSGYGEPTLHPQLFEFIKYAKDKNFLRVCLETNGSMLDDNFAAKLIESGLDILCLNLDAIDSSPDTLLNFRSENVAGRIIRLKQSLNSQIPYIVLQTINRVSSQETVNYYYRRWEHIADAVVVVPYNDYLGTFDNGEFINLTPSADPVTCCKTSQTLMVLSDGKPVLCRQKFDGFPHEINRGLHDIWISNYLRANTFGFCKKCAQKHYSDAHNAHIFDYHLCTKLKTKYYKEIVPQNINKAEKLVLEKKFDQAIDIIESILKYYPDCKQAGDIAGRLLCAKN